MGVVGASSKRGQHRKRERFDQYKKNGVVSEPYVN